LVPIKEFKFSKLFHISVFPSSSVWDRRKA